MESVGLKIDFQYPEMAPVLEEIATGEIRPWDVVLTPEELLIVLERSGTEYVALDPDTPEQQVWTTEDFKEHLLRYEF